MAFSVQTDAVPPEALVNAACIPKSELPPEVKTDVALDQEEQLARRFWLPQSEKLLPEKLRQNQIVIPKPKQHPKQVLQEEKTAISYLIHLHRPAQVVRPAVQVQIQAIDNTEATQNQLSELCIQKEPSKLPVEQDVTLTSVWIFVRTVLQTTMCISIFCSESGWKDAWKFTFFL